MHPNPAFRKMPETRAVDFARDRGFGTLAVNANGGPLLSHVPFLLEPDGQVADLHLVRSNPILRHLPSDAAIAVMGPDGYVSPDWYGVENQVPTWNYVAVHLRGRLETLPQETMRDMLDRQSAAYEDRLAKAPWTADKMTPDVLARMMRQIAPCRLAILDISSTWKVSQNKPGAVRLSAAGAVEAGLGSELPTLAALIKNPPDS